MRRTISGLVAALAVMTASAAPAMACGGLFDGSCSPCGAGYVSPCAPAPVYVSPAAPVYGGCNTGCGGWARERLPDPVHQYYYVNQGPTYSGPGNWAPVPTYQESAVSGWDAYRRDGAAIYSYRARPYFRPLRPRLGYRYSVRPGVRYGYGPRHSRYGAPVRAPGVYGQERMIRRYN